MNHPNTKIAPLICLATLSIAISGVAQGPSSSGQTQRTQTTQLPLSGRSGQNGSATAIEAPIAGTTNSVNTINPSVQVQGPYTGSSPSTAKQPFSGKLSLREAIDRGLSYNLGAMNLNNAVRQAQGQSQIARSSLLPNISGYLAETLQQINLAAQGVRIHIPIAGFDFPTIVGPFNNIDMRGSVSQSVVDLTALNNYRSSRELVHAAQFSARDARDTVVLAICGS